MDESQQELSILGYMDDCEDVWHHPAHGNVPLTDHAAATAIIAELRARLETVLAQRSQREPLSDEQIVDALAAAGLNLAFRNYEQDIECARAIEAAHGIKSAGGNDHG